ncbi:MAG TPA: ABC transporter permease [Thermoanaerobaculia bacterium]|nr:ABC transporter permease [Thermoanaerobaculia bacterium]
MLLRKPVRDEWAIALQLGSIALVLLVWYLVTHGAPEERILSPLTLPSPGEVLGQVKSLWFDAALSRGTGWSLRRILLGFGLAGVIGVPLGILAGCFRGFEAFIKPATLFLRNIPIAALIPLTLVWFGLGEPQKIFFIFIACVGFVIFDTTLAVLEVDERYAETAYTLGAKKPHVIFKVLIPLALPDIFNSLRLLFGLAFGYIVLAEVIDAKFGLGYIISQAQHRGPREHIYLVLFVISLLAFLIDRLLFLVQKQLFAYRFAEEME